MPPTLVLSPRYTPDSSALWKASLEAGWSVERLQSHRPPDWLRDKNPVLYGEALFANIVADALSLALIEPTFHWVTGLPFPYLRRKIAFAALKDVTALQSPQFVKPAYDKSFDARVYSPDDLPAVWNALPDELPVLIAEPVQWQSEFRCFALERQVMAVSAYAHDSEFTQVEDRGWAESPEALRDAVTFAAMLLTDRSIDMPPAFVLDVGQIRDRGWAVVEANPAWASGIYECNPAKVLQVLHRATVRAEELNPEDQRWVVQRLV